MRTTKVLFLDDSERKQDGCVAVGGLIVDFDRMPQLFQDVARWKTFHGIPDDAELKWSPARDSWIHKNLPPAPRAHLYREMMPFVRDVGGMVMVTVIDCRTLSWAGFNAKLRCIEWVTERFHYHLKEPAVDGCGMVVVDHFASTKEDKNFQEAFDAWCRRGTKYVQPSRVVMNAMLAPSHMNPGIQLADIVTGVTAQMCSTNQGSAPSVWPAVREMLYSSREGLRGGYGLKVWPPERTDEVYSELLDEGRGTAKTDADEPGYLDNDRLRYLYSQVLSPEELDMYFP